MRLPATGLLLVSRMSASTLTQLPAVTVAPAVTMTTLLAVPTVTWKFCVTVKVPAAAITA